MGGVEAGSCLLQTPVVIRDAGTSPFAIAFRQVLLIGVKGIERQAIGKTPFHAQRAGMMRVVAVVGVGIDVSELRIGFIVLGGLEDLGQHGGVGGNVQRNGIHVPGID